MASRWQKEENRKKAEARKGLTPEEVRALGGKEAAEEKLAAEVLELHTQLFPEEFDFMGDSRVDISDRDAGINPTQRSAQEETNRRRVGG